MNRRLLLCCAVLIAAVAVITSCATQLAPPDIPDDVPGFWSGLLHRFFILFGFIGSLFTDYRIYAFPNTGRFYDCGFLIGAAISLGGTVAASSSGK